jgi:hypothetical protein
VPGCVGRWAPRSSCWPACPRSSTASGACSCSRRCSPSTSSPAGAATSALPVIGGSSPARRWASACFTAGIVLALMVIPFIASVMRDVFETVPPVLKESAYGLGCTTWEVVATSCCPTREVGVIGGVMLGPGARAGRNDGGHLRDRQRQPARRQLLFAPGNSIASVLANEFGEADRGPAHPRRCSRSAWCCSSSPSSCWHWPSWLIIAPTRKARAPEPTRSMTPTARITEHLSLYANAA